MKEITHYTYMQGLNNAHGMIVKFKDYSGAALWKGESIKYLTPIELNTIDGPKPSYEITTEALANWVALSI